MSIDPALFRRALGHFCTGVTVITGEHDGDIRAMTASAFTSVSLDPALVLVCIGVQARINPVIQASGRYGVSILADGQRSVSDRFGRSRQAEGPGFDFERWHGLPVVPDALAHLGVLVVDQITQGDHVIHVGEVMECRLGDGAPLLYFRGGYCAPSGESPPQAARRVSDGSSP